MIKGFVSCCFCSQKINILITRSRNNIKKNKTNHPIWSMNVERFPLFCHRLKIVSFMSCVHSFFLLHESLYKNHKWIRYIFSQCTAISISWFIYVMNRVYFRCIASHINIEIVLMEYSKIAISNKNRLPLFRYCQSMLFSLFFTGKRHKVEMSWYYIVFSYYNWCERSVLLGFFNSHIKQLPYS